jgi:hypothetical protein
LGDLSFQATFDYCIADFNRPISKIITDILYTTGVLVESQIIILAQEEKKRNEQQY